MTCIVGLKFKNKIYMGSDSAGAAGNNLQIRADEKIFINGDFIIGFTSSFRMGQLIRYKFKPPEHKKGKNIFEYMVSDFIDGIRSCLKDGGFAGKHNEVEWAGNFLVGYRNRLFEIANDYQVAEVIDDYLSVGCGADLALGSLYSTKNWKLPYKRVIMALEAAEKYSSWVAPPFNILKKDWPDE